MVFALATKKTAHSMIVNLSRRDESEAILLARDIIKLKEMQGVSHRGMSLSRLDSNVIGFKAEYAVARVFDADLPSLHLINDGGVDIWIDNISVDVKVSNQKDSNLIFDSMDKFKADIALFVIQLGDNKFDLVGWITRGAFERKSKRRDFGYGERLFISPEDLQPIGKLWERIQEKRFS